MKLFDGTNLHSITKSLSTIFGFLPNQLIKEIKLCICLKRSKLNCGNLSLLDFVEHCKEGGFCIDESKLYFDRVTFFHITSFIDNGIFIRERGLLDIDELLLISSPLSEYLDKKGIKFLIKDKSPSIDIGGKVQSLRNLHCNSGWVKPRLIGRLTETKYIGPEGISGYLLLDHAQNDPTYQRIRNAPEFLCDLDDCIGGGITDEWKSISRPVILKCEVDIETWYRPGDNHKEENEYEKSYEIAEQGFFFLIDVYSGKLGVKTKFTRDNYYPFIAHGVGIPANRIKEFIYRSL